MKARARNGRRPWTQEELSLLRESYPLRATTKIAELLDRPAYSVYNAAYNLGLHKTPEFYQGEESGRLRKGETRPEGIATQFRKGGVPANKGLRRPGWSPGRMRETQFKKGCRTGIAARNWRPVGTILTDTDGYLRIKIRDAVHGTEATGFGNQKVWPFLSRHRWEQHDGPIPPGHVIVFRNRKRSDCAIENLECISRGELARRNTMWGRYPQELAQAIQLNGALKGKLRRLNGEK